ncbi:MAG: hypothetical protein ACODAB_03885 [Gemmatimonadota bacterium]
MNTRLLLVLGLLSPLATVSSAPAQQFGKNPMRTNPEFANLEMLSSGQVDVIYYAPLDTLARLALPIADSCITAMEDAYEHRLIPRERVTIFLFGDNEDYRQGWVLPGYLTPPSIGYTEPLKGNIGVSFDGDAGRLHELVCHEIAHRFQLSIRDESYADHPFDGLRERKGRYHYPPWVTEGDATFVSHGFNSLSEMVVRYVVNSDRVSFSLSDMLAQPRSILSYFLGSEFWRFTAGEYGDPLLERLRERERGIFSRLRMGDSLRVRFFKDQALYGNPTEALEGVYGVPLRELDRAFHLYLNLRFGRDYTNTLDPVMFADRVVPDPDEWNEQPDLAGPRVVQVSPERADTVVDLYYTANPDGYPGIFTLTLPYGGTEPAARPRRDPALFDMCVRRSPDDCAEYLVESADDAGAERDEADEAELTEEEREARKERERLEKEARAERERLARLAREEIAPSPRRIVRSGTERCQSLDPRTNRLEAFFDGDRRLLAYVCTDSRTQARAIAVRDLRADREIERFTLESLGNVSSPTWSPDGSRLAFAGISRSGTWDLYSVRRRDGEITRLTEDVYADGAPDWSPDGRRLVFTSDRTPFGRPGSDPGRTSSNLFLLDLESGRITYLTYGRWTDIAPRWSPDGERVLFASDREGAFDLYVSDIDGRTEKLTRISTGVLSAEWWPDGSSIVFTAYDGLSQIYRMEMPRPSGDGDFPTRVAQGGRPWTPTWSWSDELEDPLVEMARSRPLPDRFHLTLGGAGGEVGSNTGLAGLSLIYSTLDNSRILYTQFNSAWHTGDTRLRASPGKYQNLYAAAGYLNLNHRTFWGVHCYRQSGLFIDDVRSNIFGEDHLGCRVSGQHPLSLFRRWEFEVGAEWSDQADLQNLDILTFDRLRDHKDDISFTRRAALLQLGGAYVHDNTLWVGRSYPVDGTRYRLDCAIDLDIGRFQPDTYTCYGDGRLYLRLGARSNVGLRGFAFHSDGFTSRRFTLDWRNHMTLYPAFGLYGQRGWIGNAFLAFPLIERLSVRTPAATIAFPPIRGAFFADAGQAWLNEEPMGPVWAGAGIRATMPLGPLSLGVAWGARFTLGPDDIELPERFRGTTWRLLLTGTP